VAAGRIVTLTMNPAVDVSGTVERLAPAHKLRVSGARHHPGGGGINCARVLARLGAELLAVFPEGGATGGYFTRLLDEEGVKRAAVPVAGETRQNFTVDETATGEQYRFVLPGPALDAMEIGACLAALARNLAGVSWLIASGSLPPGAPDDLYARVARLARAAGARFALDTSGAPLASAMGAGLAIVKPSRRELEGLAGRALPALADVAAAARAIVASGGAEHVAVTLGADGALLASRETILVADAPAVAARTSVGAGDSFLAALVWAFEHGAGDALAYAVAAGSAALLSEGTALCRPDDIDRLAREVRARGLQQAMSR